jgi:SAM-dependent methyltransferase
MPLQSDGAGGLVTTESEAPRQTYPIVNGVPILVDFERSVLDRDELVASAGDSKIERPSYTGMRLVLKRLVSPPKQSTVRNVSRFIEAIKALSAQPRILVIGGGTVGQGMARLYEDPDIKVVAFDIYASQRTHFIGDAHHIALSDSSFDGVVIQAVLEHVIEPQRVVDEIWRVLRPRGIVYSETPFMQQVHEGAFDFTRFSDSGHRFLFRKFSLIDSGASGGPGRQFTWSLDYLVRGLFRSRTAGKVAKLLFFWVQYLDRFIPPRYAVDGASGVYFLGAKSEEEIHPREIIRYYKGAQ